MKLVLVLLVASIFNTTAFALDKGEPAFCDPSTFFSLEKKADREGLLKDRMYQIGGLTLTGLAVGHSNPEKVAGLAMTTTKGDFRADEKYCTFYLNKGESAQEEMFNHHYLAAPYAKFRHKKLKRQYTKALLPVFEGNGTTFLSCAKDHGYIAMGCNGQKHRGPTAVAMLLAYAGCNPNNAVNIVNSVWGKNMVRFATRWKLAKMAYGWGSANPKNRAQLQSIMSESDL